MDKVGSLVPEFYYDLIARMAPGVVLCIALGWDGREKLLPLMEASPAIVAALATVICYVIGFLLDVLAARTLGKVNRIVFGMLKKLKPEKAEWDIDVWKLIRSTDKDTELRLVLLKVMAERTMLRSFVLIWMALWYLEPSFLVPLNFLTKAAVWFFLMFEYSKSEFGTRRDAYRWFLPH